MNDIRQLASETDFDFDKWAQLAKTDPEQFEKMREQLIGNLFEQAPEHLKQRLEQQQWQIDQIRRQAANPLAACIQISQKMWDSVYGDRGLLMALEEPQKLMHSTKKENAAKIINLKEFKHIHKNSSS